MDWAGLVEFAKTVGLPGVMFVGVCWVVYKVAFAAIASWERTQTDRTRVEDKKADAMVSAVSTLSGKVDAHHTADLEAHAELTGDLSRIEGKLDAVHGFTPVRGIKHRTGERKPSRGEFHDGEDDE